MNGFLTDDFNRTGRAGMIIDIGKGERPGASRAINLDRNRRDGNSGMKGNSNINRGLRFSTTSNRDNSNSDNPRFGNLKGNHKEDPRLNNRNGNNINRRFNNPRDSRNPSNSVLNLRASAPGESHNTHSLRENLEEGMKNIESRTTRSLKMLSSVISPD
jgi:hypothetical protein